MPNEEKSVVNKFLEGAEENNFEQVVDPFEIPLEQKEPIIEEKPVPFHKDEKLQKYISKEVEKRLKDFTPETKVENKEEDDYYVRLIGNDTPEKVAMIKESKARDERILQQAEERAFNRLSLQEQQEQKEIEESKEELINAFESIEQNFDVDLTSARSQKVRSEFLDFITKIAPKDRDGDILEYPDMSSAWETFSEIKKSTFQPSRAKQLASNGLSRSSEATAVLPKRLNWDAADEYIESLK